MDAKETKEDAELLEDIKKQWEQAYIEWCNNPIAQAIEATRDTSGD